MRILLLSVLLMLTAVASAQTSISSGQAQCLPLREGNRYVGIRLQQQGRVLADIRFNAHDALYAMRAQRQGEQLVFSDFRTDGTWQVGSDAKVSVAFTPGNAFPLVSFRVPVEQFSPAAWEAKHGKQPLHLFACSLPGAPIFHQRGWVIPTPVVDDHVMHGAFGTASATIVSAWSPDWTYAPAIGAYPIPVVGLWKPDEGRYVGYEFFDARLSDHSERNVGSAYCWKSGAAKEFFCLTLPYARPYNQLRTPQNGDVFASRFRVLFHTSMRHEDDPNQFVNEVIWSVYRDRLTSAPPLNDLLWLPTPYRLERFPTPTLRRLLYRTKGDPFSLDGNLESYGVGWDSPIDYVYATKKEAAIAGLREDLNQLAKLAVRFEVNGEPCVYWRKPIEGDWKPRFGKGVPTLHNVNGWLIGMAFLDAYRNERNGGGAKPFASSLLPVIDGVLRWTKYILYTRNCYPDVPAAMFAWDAAPVAAFCLKYHFTFRNDPQRRELAQLALKLARSMTYRCLPLFASDNTPDDNIDASFFVEPNSGLPWLGAACANEVWETAVGVLLTYLHTGDPILGHYLRGMVERFPLLFRDEVYPSVAQYGNAFAERYGLYDGAEQPPGTHSSYGGLWGGLEKLIYPVAGAQVRVVCGERAAMAFNVQGTHTQLKEYRSAGKGHFAFRLEGKPPNADAQGRFDVVVTYPLFDLRDKPVRVNGEPREITRFAERFDTLLIRGVKEGDLIAVGEGVETAPPLPVQIAKPRPPREAWTEPGFKTVPLPANVTLNLNWDDHESMAGFFGGVRRIWGVPFALIEPSVNGGKAAVSHAVAMNQTGTMLFALIGAGVPSTSLRASSARPQLLLDYADGTRETAPLENAAPAIQGWPPVWQWRLWMLAQPLKGKLRQVTPQNCNLFALTLSDKPREQLQPILAAVQQRRAAFLAQQALLQKWQQLSNRLTRLGTLAVIPTPQVSPSAHPLMRALRFNVGAKQMASSPLKTLTPEEWVNPKTFTPAQFPIALYLGGETYHQSVREPNDGDRAMQNYLRQGGTLLVSATQPFPFYYNESGKPVVTAPKFGLPLSGSGAERRADRLAGQNVSGWEKPPADVKLFFERNAPQQIVTNLPNRFPFPSDGDLRWRPMINIWTEQEAKYTPVLTLKDDRGKLYGDGIAMVEFLQGEFKGARIVYVWHRLIANPEWANNILSDVLIYLANQTPPPLAQISVPRTHAPPQIDGALDDIAWRGAATVKLDWRFHPRNMPAFVALTPTVRTSAKLLWDDRFLYVGFECEDADAWATYTKRDAYLWEEEVVEVYLDPSGKGKHYKEFEVNPLGALIDLDILEAVNGNPGDVPSHLRWNAKDIRWAAKAQGTTDNRNDKDMGWTAEFAIPLEDCLIAGDKLFIGDSWRAQFYRIERAKGSSNETAEFQAWSPTDTFHRPERFGILHFAGDPKRGDFARYRNGSDGSPTWKISAGQWQMRDGVYVGKDCLEDGWQPHGASVGDATWKDYTVRLRYRVTQRGSDWRDGFWLGFRCGDAGGYAIEFTHREAQLHKVPASGGYRGDEHRLAVAPFTPDANWHALVVRVRGNRIEIEQDGRPLLSYTDAQPLGSGGVTLCARKWSGSTGSTVVEVAEFRVE